MRQGLVFSAAAVGFCIFVSTLLGFKDKCAPLITTIALRTLLSHTQYNVSDFKHLVIWPMLNASVTRGWMKYHRRGFKLEASEWCNEAREPVAQLTLKCRELFWKLNEINLRGSVFETLLSGYMFHLWNLLAVFLLSWDLENLKSTPTTRIAREIVFRGLAKCREILSGDQSTFTVLLSSDEGKKGTSALEHCVWKWAPY